MNSQHITRQKLVKVTSFTGVGVVDGGATPLNRRLSNPGLTNSSKLPSTHKPLNRAASAASASGASGGAFSSFVYPPAASTPSNNGIDANETDELKVRGS